MRGPIDYIVVGFDGNNFDGSVLNELDDAVEKGMIDVLAIALVIKDSEGNVTSIEANDGDENVLSELNEKYSLDSSVISDEDIEEIGEILDNDISAGFLVVEHLWAKGLKNALLNADGFLLAEGRIHPDAAKELES